VSLSCNPPANPNGILKASLESLKILPNVSYETSLMMFLSVSVMALKDPTWSHLRILQFVMVETF